MPEELKGLTQLEEMLISRIHTIMSVYTVRGGQRKSSKHIINFAQNVDRIARELPLNPVSNEIPLFVRRSSDDGIKHYDFRVRRNRVRAALEWLKENHKWYRDIQVSEDRLSQLPEDGNLEDNFLDHDGPPNMSERALLNDTLNEMDGNLDNETMGINSF